MQKIILFALLLLSSTTIYAGHTIDAYFISAPAQLIPQLDENRRKDLIDFHNAGVAHHIVNQLGGEVLIDTIDDMQITVKLSSSSSIQIALLPVADTVGVIAVVHTVSLPAQDSRITFYNTRWQPIENGKIFTAPTAKTFLNKSSKKTAQQAVDLIDMLPVSYVISGRTLQAREDLKTYLPEEVYERLAPLLKKTPLSYTWNGKRFVR